MKTYAPDQIRNIALAGHASKGKTTLLEAMLHLAGATERAGKVADGKYEITIYTSCSNLNKGIYYYTTYSNHQITAVDMHNEDLEKSELISYEPIATQQIMRQN